MSTAPAIYQAQVRQWSSTLDAYQVSFLVNDFEAAPGLDEDPFLYQVRVACTQPFGF